jgi:hypothetical protein
MKVKCIITGTTGMVGKGVLLECLESDLVESILLINRRPIGIKHQKLNEIIHKNFHDLTLIEDQLKGYNACFFCLGVSSNGKSKEDYRHLTYDLTLHCATILARQNPDMTFCYVSGENTDELGKSRMNWARVKGETENDLLDLPFKAAYMFRPGYIHPMKGVKSATGWVNFTYFFFKPLYPVLKVLFSKHITTSVNVGKAMIRVASNGYEQPRLEDRDINGIAEE